MEKCLKRCVSFFVMVMMLISCFLTVFAADDVISTVITKKGPVTIIAQNYSRASTTLKKEGKWLSFQSKQWAEFDLVAPEAGEWEVYIVSGATAVRTMSVKVNDSASKTVKMPATATYQETAEEFASVVNLNAGLNVLRVTTETACYFEAVIIKPVGLVSEDETVVKTGPFKDMELPTVVEAEDYDCGASGSYSIDGKNNGRPYRAEKIDTYETDDRKGYYITLSEGEFVKYTFMSKADKSYMLYMKGMASLLDIYIDDMNKPVFTDYLLDGKLKEQEILRVYLEKGQHQIKIVSKGGSCQLDYMRFETALGDYSVSQEVNPKKDESQNPVYKTLYLSEEGDDNNPGTEDAPFKSLKRAKEEIAKINDEMTGDIVVSIKSGYYQVTETEMFDESHSGKNGFNVIFKGEDKDNPPIISGGKKVTGWEKTDGVLWKAPLETEATVRNLYIDGHPAIRARSKYSYENKGNYDILGDAYSENGFKASAINFPTQIAKEEGLETVWTSEWTAQRALVEKVTVEGDTVFFQMEPEYWKNRNGSTYLNAGNRFYIENSFSLLDELGEFYYNKEEKCIYYYPYEEENMENVEAFIGEVECLLRIKGSDLDNKAENINFKNVEFRYGAWDNVTYHGLRARQADDLLLTAGNTYSYMPGQIDVEKAKNIDFTDCRFACLGSAAITMFDAVSDSEIKGNIFRDISASGIIIGVDEHKIPPEGMEMCKNINIENNVFNRTACEYLGAVGVFVFYERNIDIVHNTFLDNPYSQVSAGWGWGGGGDSEFCGEYNISYNHFEDAMHTLRDGAHLYTLGANLNSYIGHNYFKKIGEGGQAMGGVYTDSGSAYFTIENNVFEDTPKMWMVGLYNTHDMLARHNFVEREPDVKVERGPNNVVEDLIIVENKNWPQEAKKIMEEAGVEDEYKHLVELSKRPDYMRRQSLINKKLYEVGSGWLEAEDYMPGGINVGYYTTNNRYNNNLYREEGVELTSLTGDGWIIHKNAGGEWMKYEVDIPHDGEYDFYIKAAQGWADSATQPGFKVSIDDEVVIEEFIFPKTSWNILTPKKAATLDMKKGKHVMKVEILHNGIYIDAFNFVPKGTDLGETQDPNFDDGKIVNQNGEIIEIKTGFDDIKGHWAENAINVMTEKGYINGFDKNTFGPDKNVTLYQAVWLSMRCMDFEYDEKKGIEDALNYGIVEKAEKTDREINREEFISIIMKAYNKKYEKNVNIKEVNKFFDDSEVSEGYKDFVYAARKLGFIEGDEKGNFNPQKNLSRAEAVTVLNNILK